MITMAGLLKKEKQWGFLKDHTSLKYLFAL